MHLYFIHKQNYYEVTSARNANITYGLQVLLLFIKVEMLLLYWQPNPV